MPNLDAVVFGKGKPAVEVEEKSPSSSPDVLGTAGEDAAADVIAAVKDGDAKALSMALQRHYEATKEDESEV